MRLRAANMSSVGAVDVFVTAANADLSTATPTFPNVGVKAASAYAPLATGTYQIRAVPAGTAPAARAAAVSFNMTGVALTTGGTVRTILIADKSSGGAPLVGFLLADRSVAERRLASEGSLGDEEAQGSRTSRQCVSSSGPSTRHRPRYRHEHSPPIPRQRAARRRRHSLRVPGARRRRSPVAQQQPGLAPPRPLLATIPSDAATLTWTPKHTDLVYTFGGAPPRQRIKPSTRIVTWTEDCFDGAVKTAADLPSKVMAPGHDNPQTGPFYIEGAKPGDTVAVHICASSSRRATTRCRRSVRASARWSAPIQTAMLGADFPETTWRYDVDARAQCGARRSRATASTRGSVPLAPFLGCLGVAPALARRASTIVPGNFGGNMDCPEVRAGNTVFLGVNVPGALLSFGDGHYAMGEGEIMGAAIEGAMNVEVYVELHEASRRRCRASRTRTRSCSSAADVRSRTRRASRSRRWSAGCADQRDDARWTRISSYHRTRKRPIIQLVDPEYTVLVKLAKNRLPR